METLLDKVELEEYRTFYGTDFRKGYFKYTDVKEAVNDYKLFCRLRKKIGNTPVEEIMPDYEYLSKKYNIIIGFPIARKEDEMFDIIFGDWEE